MAIAQVPASIDALLADRRVWRGQPVALPPARQPTGLMGLDDALPTGGWPDAALSELLLPADGVGELGLLLPTLARLTRAGRDIALVAPPCLPYPPGWRQAGVDFGHVHMVDANPREALWAAEQCLRAGCLAAVLCWPRQADDRALRRLQVACESGQALGFALRDARAAANPSPAALRLLFERGEAGMRLRVLKCRGGNAPARAIALEHPAGQGSTSPVEATAASPSVMDRPRPQPASPVPEPARQAQTILGRRRDAPIQRPWRPPASDGVVPFPAPSMPPAPPVSTPLPAIA